MKSALMKNLASSNKRVRDKAFDILKHWMTSRGDLPEEALLKIWKALFYCFYQSDTWPVQSALASGMAEVLLSLNERVAISFLSAFLETMRREWSGIDTHRMDKYCLLVRRMVTRSVEYGTRADLTENVADAMMQAYLREGFLGEKHPTGAGLGLHLADVFSDDLQRLVSAGDFETSRKLLSTALEAVQQGDDRLSVQVMRTVVTSFIDTTDELITERSVTGEDIVAIASMANLCVDVLGKRREAEKAKEEEKRRPQKRRKIEHGHSDLEVWSDRVLARLRQLLGHIENPDGDGKDSMRSPKKALSLSPDSKAVGRTGEGTSEEEEGEARNEEDGSEEDEEAGEVAEEQEGQEEEDEGKVGEEVDARAEQGAGEKEDHEQGEVEEGEEMEEGEAEDGGEEEGECDDDDDDSNNEEKQVNDWVMGEGEDVIGDLPSLKDAENMEDGTDNDDDEEMGGENNDVETVPDSLPSIKVAHGGEEDEPDGVHTPEGQIIDAFAPEFLMDQLNRSLNTPYVSSTGGARRARSSAIKSFGEEGGSSVKQTKSAPQSGKRQRKVRFVLSQNLVTTKGGPVPPPSLRTPPNLRPRGSALKKGVRPGPVLVTKLKNTSPNSMTASGRKKNASVKKAGVPRPVKGRLSNVSVRLANLL